MDKDYILTVIITVYNKEKYIRQCLNSIISQKYDNLDIIIMDDGSTDNSGKICDEYKTDDRVRVFHQNNIGVKKTRLKAINFARGNYVTFVDADDFIDESMYFEMMEHIISQKVDFVLCGIIRYFKEDIMRYDLPSLNYGFYNKKSIISKVFPTMIWNDTIGAAGIDQSLCSKIVKKEYLKRAMERAKDIDIYLNEDAIVIYPLIKDIESMYVIRKCFYFHRQKDSKKSPEYLKDRDFFHKLYKFYFYMLNEMGENYRSQIDKYYIKFVNYKNTYYYNTFQKTVVYYPFDIFNKDTKFIIYGAGDYGTKVYDLYIKTGFGNLVAWVDKNFRNINRDFEVCSVDDIKKYDYDYVLISISSEKIANEIINELVKKGVNREKIIWRKNIISYIPNKW